MKKRGGHGFFGFMCLNPAENGFVLLKVSLRRTMKYEEVCIPVALLRIVHVWRILQRKVCGEKEEFVGS
jgi:hypothetical protein